MKMLLCSMGLTNKSIENALISLIDKDLTETNVVYVPTASNMISGNKDWVIDALSSLEILTSNQLKLLIFLLLKNQYGAKVLKTQMLSTLKEDILTI